MRVRGQGRKQTTILCESTSTYPSRHFGKPNSFQHEISEIPEIIHSSKVQDLPPVDSIREAKLTASAGTGTVSVAFSALKQTQ